MNLPTIYLVRHGETEWSRDGRHTGRTDLPLTPIGEADGRRLGPRLSGINFAHIFSSPLLRARHTAELAGFTPEMEPDLMEWDYGEYEGLTSAEIRDRRSDWLLFRDGCPNGEQPADIAARADRVVARLQASAGNVLCFAHGHMLRVLTARWAQQPVTFATYLLLGTGTVSILSFNHGKLNEPAIRTWNS